jgi:hypothetical protein
VDLKLQNRNLLRQVPQPMDTVTNSKGLFRFLLCVVLSVVWIVHPTRAALPQLFLHEQEARGHNEHGNDTPLAQSQAAQRTKAPEVKEKAAARFDQKSLHTPVLRSRESTALPYFSWHLSYPGDPLMPRAPSSCS